MGLHGLPAGSQRHDQIRKSDSGSPRHNVWRSSRDFLCNGKASFSFCIISGYIFVIDGFKMEALEHTCNYPRKSASYSKRERF